MVYCLTVLLLIIPIVYASKSNYITRMLKVRNFEIAITINIYNVIFTEFKYFTMFQSERY